MILSLHLLPSPPFSHFLLIYTLDPLTSPSPSTSFFTFALNLHPWSSHSTLSLHLFFTFSLNLHPWSSHLILSLHLPSYPLSKPLPSYPSFWPNKLFPAVVTKLWQISSFSWLLSSILYSSLVVWIYAGSHGCLRRGFITYLHLLISRFGELWFPSHCAWINFLHGILLRLLVFSERWRKLIKRNQF